MPDTRSTATTTSSTSGGENSIHWVPAEGLLALYQERHFDLTGDPAKTARIPSQKVPAATHAGHLLIDASKHGWFRDHQYYDLIVVLDRCHW